MTFFIFGLSTLILGFLIDREIKKRKEEKINKMIDRATSRLGDGP